MNRHIIFSLIIFLAIFCTTFVYAGTDQTGTGPAMMEHGEYMQKIHKEGRYGRGMGYGMGYGVGVHSGGEMHDYCYSYLAVIDELDISDEQAEKMRKQKSRFRKEQIRLQAAMKVAKIDYKDLLSAEKVNMKAVEKKVREIADLVAEEMMNSAKASSEMRSVLSKGQRAKLKDLMRERKLQCRMLDSGSKISD